MDIDPTLETLWRAAIRGMYDRPRDLASLRVLGDYYEERGHAGSADACRRSEPPDWPPILTYLESLGWAPEAADKLRKGWGFEEIRAGRGGEA